MLHIQPTNLLFLPAKQEPYKKVYLITKNIDEISGKNSGEWTSRQRKDRTERVIGLGRRTREEIVKWNQMTALRFQTGGDIRHPRPTFRGRGDNKKNQMTALGFQTGGRHQTSPASLQGPHKGTDQTGRQTEDNFCTRFCWVWVSNSHDSTAWLTQGQTRQNRWTGRQTGKQTHLFYVFLQVPDTTLAAVGLDQSLHGFISDIHLLFQYTSMCQGLGHQIQLWKKNKKHTHPGEGQTTHIFPICTFLPAVPICHSTSSTVHGRRAPPQNRF